MNVRACGQRRFSGRHGAGLQEHRTLTGHTLALMLLPPNAIANPN
jgi:hypothetical protein